MAKLFPPLDIVDSLKVKPTQGERKLLTFLDKTLDDNYEIYFQPYLNGDNPDIIIMRENSGVMIIEVKDWDLESYKLNESRNWVLKNTTNKFGKPQIIKSPIQQVFEYKENLYNLHIESLLEKRIKNPKVLSIVSCAVYFHNATKEQIDTLLTEDFKDKESYIKFLSYFDLIGFDTLTSDNFKNIISKRWLDRKSYLFDESLYKSFKRYLKPPTHATEQGIQIIYTDEQQRVIQSKADSQQKVKGVAGSGKTLALAKRAVNAYLRHNGEVLILTFNISLRNYIHDRISEVRENFEWRHFTILHYHHFLKAHNNNVNFVDDGENKTRPEGKTFQTIIIDEVQDYQKEWISNIKQFLAPQGEFVVFGDEKQNIYQRTLEEKKPYTGIPGAWNILKKSFRVTTDIANLATRFQRDFFSTKYEYDEIIVQREIFDVSLIKYFYLSKPSTKEIMKIYSDILSATETHDNDVCFQSSKVDILRSIDKEIREVLHKKTNTMFETQDVYENLKADLTDTEGKTKEDKLKMEIDKVRRYKKFNFWMNSGTTKLSTTHSFKGWEIPTLFLIVENESDDENEFTTDELIYTAFTRCRQNLIVINIANQRYHNFFKQYE